jgi:hypothetical protein
MRTSFIPQRKLNPIPETKFVIDDAKVILYYVLGRADCLCDFAVLEPLGD